MIVDRSYIYSPDWIENKKALINPMNFFLISVSNVLLLIASNHEKIKKRPAKTNTS